MVVVYGACTSTTSSSTESPFEFPSTTSPHLTVAEMEQPFKRTIGALDSFFEAIPSLEILKEFIFQEPPYRFFLNKDGTQLCYGGVRSSGFDVDGYNAFLLTIDSSGALKILYDDELSEREDEKAYKAKLDGLEKAGWKEIHWIREEGTDTLDSLTLTLSSHVTLSNGEQLLYAIDSTPADFPYPYGYHIWRKPDRQQWLVHRHPDNEIHYWTVRLNDAQGASHQLIFAHDFYLNNQTLYLLRVMK